MLSSVVQTQDRLCNRWSLEWWLSYLVWWKSNGPHRPVVRIKCLCQTPRSQVIQLQLPCLGRKIYHRGLISPLRWHMRAPSGRVLPHISLADSFIRWLLHTDVQTPDSHQWLAKAIQLKKPQKLHKEFGNRAEPDLREVFTPKPECSR